MRILVIGSGGREHALLWKLAQSPKVTKLYCAPGNGGTGRLAEAVDLPPTDLPGLADFAESHRVDLTVVGPELPLTLGIVDLFGERGLPIVGPTRLAAELEGSKAFAKAFMARHGILTAPYRSFSRYGEAQAYLQQSPLPLVIKADGLAGGKGVVICGERQEALQTLHRLMVERGLGAAGAQVVVESFLSGEEVSFFALVDGESALPLVSAQDHKPLFDGDRGPNTGGMGAYSPAPVVTPQLEREIMANVIMPTVRGMAEEGRPYRGVLYAGLMIHDGHPHVLEYNVRFGDPECQPILVRFEGDLLPALEAAATGRLTGLELVWRQQTAVCVVMAAAGYPGVVERGREIEGVDRAEALPGVVVFHAGTVVRQGRLLTDGGRVLGVTALAPSIAEAVQLAYRGVDQIGWPGVHYRRDIGYRALARQQGGL